MARKIAADAPEAIATARFIRMSPTKARQVVDLIRGRHIDDARRVLAFTSKAATEPVAKVLESAVANAEHNRGLIPDELMVVRTWVDEGPTLKRFRPRAMGRATRIRKRTCHISVVVGRPGFLETEPPVIEETEAEAPKKKTTAKKTTAKKTTAKKTTKKTTAKKTTKKTTAKKTTAKKTTAKKTAAKRTTAKKTTKKKSEEGES
ncbi:MAG: 50S ribosomal protein L22 [Actinobacteria bacterium]|nr:50S ribosomal protein L22 [Actinomycetota bacterium]